MATHTIKTLTDASLNTTSQDVYDILILGESEGTATAGQVIASYGGHSVSLVTDLESYALCLNKTAATLSVGGNYDFQKTPLYVTRDIETFVGNKWKETFAGPFTQNVQNCYNIYHFTFNQEYVSGAVKFGNTGARLILTAQNGAGKANLYHTAQDIYDLSGNRLMKTDDSIRIFSKAYGMYSQYDNSATTRTNYLIYQDPTNQKATSAPNARTVNYTIHAVKDLTVVSDLSGTISATAAALHNGYLIYGKDGKHTVGGDSSGNEIVAAGIKADSLILNGNFRASVYAQNNQSTFLDGMPSNASAAKFKWYETLKEDSETHLPVGEPNYKEFKEGTTYLGRTWNTWGTTIAAATTATANNNTINTYGIWVDGDLTTAADSVWAGSIGATTSDVRIIADTDYLLRYYARIGTENYWTADPDKTVGSAVGNQIGAYGIRSDGTLSISKMDGLRADNAYNYDNAGGSEQYATISARAKNNLIYANGKNSKDKNASVSIGLDITAAAIYAETLNLGVVTDKVTLNAEIGNNYLIGSSGYSISASGEWYAYGIYAGNAAFGSFDGRINVIGGTSSVQTTGTISTGSTKTAAMGIRVGSAMTAAGNFGGTITVSGSVMGTGINAGSISVSGVIDSDITVSTGFGIYSGKIQADAFTGTISSEIGINVINTISSGAADDAFDVTGTITGGYAIVSGGALNLRISGTINSYYAVTTDTYLDQKGIWFVSSVKHPDRVELSSTAVVNGNIDLGGAETNTMIVSSAATFRGEIVNTTARLNMTINLEQWSENHVTISTGGFDASHYNDTLTLTVNLNYAEEGKTYRLYQYENPIAKEAVYWKDRLISFQYQGCAGALTLTEQGDGSLAGTAQLKDLSGNVYATVNGNFANIGGKATFSVTVVDIYQQGEGGKTYAAKTPAALVFDYTDATAENYIAQQYDAAKNSIKLDWNPLDPEQYGLAAISAYEVEYILFDADGNQRGNSIVTRTTASEVTIKGVENNTKFQWRMRALGDNSANTVTQWSAYYTVGSTSGAPVTTYVPSLTPSDKDYFREETCVTTSIDSSPNAGITGIQSAVADLSWTKMGSAKPVRNYIIQYVMYDKQVTRNDIDDSVTLEEYIAGNTNEAGKSLFFDAAGTKPIYQKVITGTQVSVSDLQNASFGYWRIRAVDDDGYASDWVAGKTFRVWTNNDTTAPVFLQNDRTIAIEKTYATPDDVTKPAYISSGTIGWKAAQDMESGVANYVVETSTDGGKTYTEWKTVSAEDLRKTVVNGTTCDYTLSIKDFVGPQFAFRIQAVDYFGKRSDYITGGFVEDAEAPVFRGKSEISNLERDNSDPSDVQITPTFSWFEATDDSDLGVRYYSVEIRQAGVDEDGNEYEWQELTKKYPADADANGKFTYTPAALDATKYEYRISAVDTFGRTTTQTGTFGSEDMDAPVGAFGSDDTFRASVSAVFGTKTITVTETDSEGKTTTTEYEAPDPTKVESAVVTLSWNDSFSDPAGVIYRVFVQNDQWVPTVSYDFWTTVEDGRSITFDNSTPGRPVSIFEKLGDKSGNIWWRVEAYDTNYNKAGGVSGQYTFSFTDDATGQAIVNSIAPAAPTGIRLTKTYEDGKYTDDIALQWNSSNTLLGIYGYTVTLTGKNGNTYSKSTVDTSNYLTADIDPDIQITGNETYNTLRIASLKDFFNGVNFAQDDYTVTVTAVDAAGRATVSAGADLIFDTMRPTMVDYDSVKVSIIPVNENGKTENCVVVLTWDPASDAKGIAYYEVYRRELVKDASGNIKMSWNQATVKRVYGTTYSEGMSAEYAGCDYRIVAVDNTGNKSLAWDADLSVAAIPQKDLFGDSLTDNVKQLTFTGSRLTAADSVGLGDPADVFSIDADEGGMALNITAGIREIPVSGTNGTVKVEIFEGANLTKVWKSCTVKSDGRLFTDLLLQGGTTYTFRVTPADKNSVANFSLTLDRTVLHADTKDDTFDKADNDYTAVVGGNYDLDPDTGTYFRVPAGTGSYAKPYEVTVDGGIGSTTVVADWVGFGDTSDVRVLELENAGRYDFTLGGVALSTKLTVYELLDNGKSKVLKSVTATQSNVAGVSTGGLLLDNGKRYFIQIDAGSKTAIGSDYTVSIRCDEAYPAPTTDDDTCSMTAPALALGGAAVDGWVTFTDPQDYYRINVAAAGAFTIKLDGVNGKEICAAVGYVNAKGSFQALTTVTGTAGATQLVLSRQFTDKEIASYGNDYFVKIYTNGTAANSPYSVSYLQNDLIPGFNTADDRLLTKKQADDAAAKGETLPVYGTLDTAAPVDDWVGLGDAADYRKLDLSASGSGLYQLEVSGAENPLKATVYRAEKDAAGNVTAYKAVGKSVSLTAANNFATIGGLLLDKGTDYYVGIDASGAAKGQNSAYTLTFTATAVTTQLGNPAGDDTIWEDLDDLSVTAGYDRVFLAPANGGGYDFTVYADDATGAVKLSVYELLTNGSTRTVKTITVNAGSSGHTGYLYFDDQAVANGTGIYMLSVQGANAKSSGTFDLEIEGYEFGAYIDDADAPITIGDWNWVGQGDPMDTTGNFFLSGVHSIEVDGDSNIKVSLLENGKVKKSFTPAAGSSFTTVSYDFQAGATYEIQVASADNGKTKFSEYLVDLVDHSDESAILDNSFAELFADPAGTGAPTDTSFGWVGLSDAADYARLDVAADDCYQVNLGGLQNDAKVTVYEATAWNDDGSVKTAKALATVTAKGAVGAAVIGNLYLDDAKEYYISVQALNTSGTKDTDYHWTLNSMTDVSDLPAFPVGDNTVYFTSDHVRYRAPSDYYQFTAKNGGTDISLDLTDRLANVTLTLWQVDTATGKYTKVTSLAASSTKPSISTGDLALTGGGKYVIEVAAPANIAPDVILDYDLTVTEWAFADFDTANNTVAEATALGIGEIASSAVWFSGDRYDFYQVDAVSAGSYSLELSDFNGSKVKVSIGTLDAKGNFKALQSITGKAGAEQMLLSRNLESGTYYIMVESPAKNMVSQYTISLTNNSAGAGFSNADDTWKAVAADPTAHVYDSTTDNWIDNWLGFGDAADFFKFTTDENGRIAFNCGDLVTQDAAIAKQITMALFDGDGKSVALDFDSTSGSYTSKVNLMADREYYLSVSSTKTKEVNTDYCIAIDKVV